MMSVKLVPEPGDDVPAVDVDQPVPVRHTNTIRPRFLLAYGGWRVRFGVSSAWLKRISTVSMF